MNLGDSGDSSSCMFFDVGFQHSAFCILDSKTAVIRYEIHDCTRTNVPYQCASTVLQYQLFQERIFHTIRFLIFHTIRFSTVFASRKFILLLVEDARRELLLLYYQISIPINLFGNANLGYFTGAIQKHFLSFDLSRNFYDPRLSNDSSAATHLDHGRSCEVTSASSFSQSSNCIDRTSRDHGGKR